MVLCRCLVVRYLNPKSTEPRPPNNPFIKPLKCRQITTTRPCMEVVVVSIAGTHKGRKVYAWRGFGGFESKRRIGIGVSKDQGLHPDPQ